MDISVFFEFNGNASEALEYYKGIFGGEVYKVTYGEMPSEGDFVLPDEQKSLIAFASINVNGSYINMSDVLPGFGPELSVGNNVTVMYSTDSYDEAQKIYDTLSDKGQVIMPFAPTSWAKGFGVLCDQFGIQWKINVDENCN